MGGGPRASKTCSTKIHKKRLLSVGFNYSAALVLLGYPDSNQERQRDRVPLTFASDYRDCSIFMK